MPWTTYYKEGKQYKEEFVGSVTEDAIEYREECLTIAKHILSETDWYVTRFQETGKAIPNRISTVRDFARGIPEDSAYLLNVVDPEDLRHIDILQRLKREVLSL